MSKFKVGDKVRYVGSASLILGLVGADEVVTIYGFSEHGVLFKHPNAMRSDGCIWCPEGQLELVEHTKAPQSSDHGFTTPSHWQEVQMSQLHPGVVALIVKVLYR